eukprot:TRINITY_DN1340_c0_g1_i1.p1 TRINITY_DN1340_c0_g1~~TRINITY_DN1340_c0_g1_i1.p1  ORF type:complete len:203 (-),score=37.38 TRINITY_DN1340_c0_g1_i1:75-644(-)
METSKNSEEYNDQKRCARCAKFYTDEAAGPCYYHPGDFEPTIVLEGSDIGWTCCRYIDDDGTKVPNPDAHVKSSIGCTQKGSHKEDMVYTETISHFPHQTSQEIEMHQDVPSIHHQRTESKSTKDEDGDTTFKSGALKHKISKDDTLMGISLKYGVSLDKLQAVNNLYSQDIGHKSELLIPAPTTSARQ